MKKLTEQAYPKPKKESKLHIGFTNEYIIN